MKVSRKINYVFWVAVLAVLLSTMGGNMISSQTEGQSRGVHFVMAKPGPIEIQQPDGSKLTIMKYGDERLNYTRTTDGFTLMQDDAGFYCYAALNANSDMVITPRRATNVAKRSKKDSRFLENLPKFLNFSITQKQERIDKWNAAKGITGNLSGANFGPIDDAFPSTGNRNMLVILTGFSDKTFVLPASNFNAIMNTGSSSFKAFYLDNSYNLLNVTTTVIGPYNINMTMSQADNNTRDYFSRVVDAAEADGVDFSLYDNNNDGAMDALYFIHAGYGEEAGAPSNTIWSHSWDLGSYARNYDGVSIFSYATSPELRGASGSTITSIGVICHEFGHNIGIPDYYDTDGNSSGGNALGLGRWDVMAGGSWNNNGDTPAQHCMYTKWKMGWANPAVINSTASLSLRNTSDYNEAYRFNSATTNEFFILENRQQTGWDSALPGSGMLIYHVDGNMIDNLNSNSVNTNPSHQGLDIEEADGTSSSSNYSGDPFPGSGNKTSFTDTTSPSSKSWANAYTNKPVTNITESNGVIDFDFMSGGGASTLTVTSPNGGETWAKGSTHAITWTSTGSITSVKIEYSINNGKKWKVVANSTANDGSHQWTLPTPRKTKRKCKVRISEVGGSTTDTSDANFKIN